MTSINVDSANSAYASVDGVLFSKDMSLSIECPSGKTGDYVVPYGVTTIEGSAFFGGGKLASRSRQFNNHASSLCGDSQGF